MLTVWKEIAGEIEKHFTKIQTCPETIISKMHVINVIFNYLKKKKEKSNKGKWKKAAFSLDLFSLLATSTPGLTSHIFLFLILLIMYLFVLLMYYTHLHKSIIDLQMFCSVFLYTVYNYGNWSKAI